MDLWSFADIYLKTSCFGRITNRHHFIDQSMAGKPRMNATGAVYHVMLRGNGGQAVFFLKITLSSSNWWRKVTSGLIIRIPEYGRLKRLRDEPMLDLSEISKKVCNVYQVAESFINADNRSQFAAKIRSLVTLLHFEQSCSITRVAEYLEKEISTVSKNLKKLKQKRLIDSQLRQEIETLKNPKIQALHFTLFVTFQYFKNHHDQGCLTPFWLSGPGSRFF